MCSLTHQLEVCWQLVVGVVLGGLFRISTMVLARKTVKLESSMTVNTPCRQHLTKTPPQPTTCKARAQLAHNTHCKIASGPLTNPFAAQQLLLLLLHDTPNTQLSSVQLHMLLDAVAGLSLRCQCTNARVSRWLSSPRGPTMKHSSTE